MIKINEMSKFFETEMSKENTLSRVLSDEFDMDSNEAMRLVQQLSLSEYHRISTLIQDGDIETVASELGIGKVEEVVNYYDNDQTPSNSAISGPKVGDKVLFTGDNGEEISGEISTSSGDTASVSTNNGIASVKLDNTVVIDDNTARDIDRASASAQDELARIKRLAGIETDHQTGETSELRDGGLGEMATGGAITSGAIAGALTPLNVIKKRNHVDKKPGPKPKKNKEWK